MTRRTSLEVRDFPGRAILANACFPMHSFQRRQFLRHLTATLGGITVAGCGGGNSEAEAAATASPDTALADSRSPSIPGPAPYITPDPGVALNPTSSSTGAMQFSLASPSDAASAPVSYTHLRAHETDSYL